MVIDTLYYTNYKFIHFVLRLKSLYQVFTRDMNIFKFERLRVLVMTSNILTNWSQIL